MSGSRVRVVRFRVGEQEAALPADAVADVDAAEGQYAHLAPLLGVAPAPPGAEARTLFLRCQASGKLPVRVDGPVQFGHLDASLLVELPTPLKASIGRTIVGLWLLTGAAEGALGWRLSLEAVCERATLAAARADAQAGEERASE